ncbi:hypothetical protein ACQKWADRAFT_299807 [Trichoderma austrokoningii]
MGKHYDVALWLTHVTDEDCDLIVRTNNGWLFDCNLHTRQFRKLPEMKHQYLTCLELLRSCEEEIDGFYLEDALDWLLRPFESFITQTAPATVPLPVMTASGRPTLSQYLHPHNVSCVLDTKHNQLQPILSQNPEQYAWRPWVLKLDNDFAKDLNKWTMTFYPSNIELYYAKPSHTLIKPPTRVIVSDPQGQPVSCFFKPFSIAFGGAENNFELKPHRKLAKLTSSELQVCRLYGVVQDSKGLVGMLFPYIDEKRELTKWLIKESSTELRQRWASQIERAIKKLHKHGIIWGDAKAENILIDNNRNAWVTDFGGGYTDGWVDRDQAGTLAGDEQALKRIKDMLR